MINWQKDVNRLPVIVRGARQVGKSYIIEDFGRQNFEYLTVANFEFQPELAECFDTLIPQQIIKKLELYITVKLFPVLLYYF